MLEVADIKLPRNPPEVVPYSTAWLTAAASSHRLFRPSRLRTRQRSKMDPRDQSGITRAAPGPDPDLTMPQAVARYGSSSGDLPRSVRTHPCHRQDLVVAGCGRRHHQRVVIGPKDGDDVVCVAHDVRHRNRRRLEASIVPRRKGSWAKSRRQACPTPAAVVCPKLEPPRLADVESGAVPDVHPAQGHQGQ